MTSVLCAPRFLYAPVEKNEIIGNIEYYTSDRLVYKSNIISSEVKSRRLNKWRLIAELFKFMLLMV